MGVMNKKVLLVAGDFVYPPNHGGRVDIWNRILALREIGMYIHLICTVKKYPSKEYIDVVNNTVDELTLIVRKNRLRDMFCIRPQQMVSRNGLKKVVLGQNYDYLILEGAYVYDIINNPTLKTKTNIMRMHNDESKYFKGLCNASDSVLKKFYYFIEYIKFKNIDAEMLKKINNIMFISSDEMKKYKSKYPAINSCFLPTAINLDFKRRKLEKNNVLIIGSLFMPNNREGIKFYIKKIHSLLQCVSGYTLIIAGNSNGEGVGWVKKITQQYNNIEVYDTPKELEPFYENAAVFVNPMLNGAGVKLKTVNAIIQGVPVVTTTVGNEGTGLLPNRDVFVADEYHELADCIKTLLDNKMIGEEMVKNAQEHIKKNYNQKEILCRYLRDLKP